MRTAARIGANVRWPACALFAVAILAGNLPATAADGAVEHLPDNIRDVTAPGMSRLPVVEGGLVERIAPRLAVKPAREPKPVTWTRTEVIAAGHLRSGEVELIIAGIAPLASDATCWTGAQSWPCGNFARAAFQRLVRHRPITCEEAPTVDGRYKGNCAVAGHDLGQWLVRQGWAVPRSEHQYQDALAAAQRDRVGQWRTAPPAN